MSVLDELIRQRAVVRASLDVPEPASQAAYTEALTVLHEHAKTYAGPMPTRKAAEWTAWRTKVEAFEWLVLKRLYRNTGVT